MKGDEKKQEYEEQSEEDKQWKKLMYWLKKGGDEEQLKALKRSINVIKKEIKGCKDTVDDNSKHHFPHVKFMDILKCLLSTKKNNSTLIEKFHEITNFPDIVFFFWTCLPKIMLKETQSKFYRLNLLEIIHKMALPKNAEDPDLENCKLLFENKDFTWNYEVVKRSINKVWGRTRSWIFSQESKEVHKKHLIVMVERIMPHLHRPIVWTDYLMESLKVEGSIAFLALQGVYNLMTKFNIEVPQIYTKLYNMFQPEVFHSKYKSRLFYLADLFLSSTHLPESMVASFIKRCSRLTLVAPVEDIIIIVHLVCDLMIRHPGLKKMVDCSSKDEESNELKKCKEDPFLEDESDPMQTRAIESSLWEIRSLERHILPSISSVAKYIKQTLPVVEFGITSRLDDTANVIFNRELKRRYNDVALNFERPKKMALQKDERIHKYWTFED